MSDVDPSVAPRTIGELRRRLEEMGRPWTVPSRYSDDDPLPMPARGGQEIEPGHVEGVRAIESAESFEEELRSVPPTNPFLIERWRELGALPAETTPGAFGGGISQAPSEEWGVG